MNQMNQMNQMKRILLAATAVTALVVGGNLASAQTGHSEHMGQSPTPGAERGAVQEHRGAEPGAMNGQVETKAPTGNGAEHQRAAQSPKGERTGETREPAGREGERAGETREQKSTGAKTPKQNEHVGQGRAQTGQAPGRERDEKMGEGREHDGRMGESREHGDRAVQLSPEQRTRVRDTIVREHDHRIDHADFALSVGTRIPRSERVYELPPDLISIVPEYRGFKYILVRDELVILDPVTLEIVAVIPV
ncbi:MAG: DUF1236 domain-containing protein [Xanthobacteraceae bacterium]